MHPPPRPRAAGKSKILEGKAYVVGQICLPLIGIGLITNLPNYDADQSSRPHTFRQHCAPCLVEKMAYISHGSNAWLYKRASKSFHVIKNYLAILMRLAYITFLVSRKSQNLRQNILRRLSLKTSLHNISAFI